MSPMVGTSKPKTTAVRVPTTRATRTEGMTVVTRGKAQLTANVSSPRNRAAALSAPSGSSIRVTTSRVVLGEATPRSGQSWRKMMISPTPLMKPETTGYGK